MAVKINTAEEQAVMDNRRKEVADKKRNKKRSRKTC